MQREVIKWLQSLDLTYQVRHPQQDLSNGFTLAEIASRYDRRVAMHSYVPGCSTECKRRNWKMLLRDLKRIECETVTAEMAEATVQGKPGVASAVLDILYEFFYGRAVPPRTKNNNETTTALVDVMDAAWAEKEGSDAVVPQGNEPLPLRTMENDEIALGKGLRKPGFARPTAAALLHVANRETRNAQLTAAVPPDELRTLRRNEKLLNEHEMLQKAYRYAEPQRFAALSHQRRVLAEKPKGKEAANRKGTCRDHHVAIDKVFQVDVNVMNKQLLSALRSRDGVGIDGGGDHDDKTPESCAREVLETCGNNLRIGLSKLLGMTLQTNGFSDVLELLGGEDALGDVMCTFVGQREQLPFAAVVACWTTLLRASDGIASALVTRPTEYMYLLRALNFIFGAEVVHIRLLHVSSSPEDYSAPEEKSDLAATVTSATTSGVLRDGNRTQRAMTGGDALLSASEDSDKPQQAVFSNVRVFNLASAFCLLYSVGKAVHAKSKEVAFTLLIEQFIPAVTRLFPLSSTTILEAVARVVVAHVCGDGSLAEGAEPTSTQGEENGPRQQPVGQEWNSTHKLTTLLAGPLKRAFSQCGPAASISPVLQRSQYNLFLYHVLCHTRAVLGNNYETCNKEKDAVSVRVPLTEGSLSSPVELCASGVYLCLGSPSLQERCIGLAMLLQILAWDRWDLAIDPLVLVVNDVKERGASSGFLHRAAEAWECRVLLLELLTIALRKALYLIADCSEEIENNTTSSTSTPASAVASVVKEKLDFSHLEEVTVTCLLMFSEAPLLQRQLALQIVGRRLLPDEQRNVAAVWLRGLFLFPVEQIDFLLRPHEATPLRMPDPMVGTQPHAHSRPQSRHTATDMYKEEHLVSDVQPAEGTGRISGPEGTSDKNVSSLRVLLGRVEPAYIVAPLNQSWDTFSVVQATLMFEEMLTTSQVFSVILAALLSPQRREMLRQRLLQNLRAIGVANGGEVTAPTEKCSNETPPSVGNKTDEDNEAAFSVTLRSLVATYGRADVTSANAGENSGGKGVENSDTTAAAAADASASEKAAGAHDRSDEQVVDGQNEEEKQMEMHVKAFWISVLRVLKQQLQKCLSDDTPLQEQKVADGTERSADASLTATTTSEETRRRDVCRISPTENPRRLRELAAAVLLTLHRRYCNNSSLVSEGEPPLHAAWRWLAVM
ncbi:Spermatogenesis-associated protein 4 [Trypanosoma grayi]|uniref:Spermatogenesis-associated protein 4 n=1 Tax=Trypanosoma grayi TaxID=71804 RepID=UPI0004F44A6B|nr:Spermatogenesis-associated protein 4 [Trypanosoma grayi]KEG12426.1 Spermatogenesis-associated protein 4 [Trypanosoma grayi]